MRLFLVFSGEEAYPSLQQKAARLCFGLVKTHPFIDGNKRIGAHVMLVFLSLNGIDLCYTQDELVKVTLKLASGEIGHEALRQWICSHQLKDD